MDTKAEALLALDFDVIDYLDAIPSRRLSHYGKDTTIFKAGDPADTVYFLKEGHVALSSHSDNGKEAVIGIIKPGECFGQVCVFKSEVRAYTAVAITDGVLALSFSRRIVVDMIERDTKFAKALILDLLKRVDRVEQELTHRLNSKKVDEMLARSLLQMADKDGMIGNVSQALLARRVGTTRSRLGLYMRSFQDAGLLHYDGQRGLALHIKLNAPAMLEWLHQD